MRKKWLFIVILICVLTMSICVCFMDASYRWSGRLCEAIRASDTALALQLIDEGVQKGYSMDTLSMRPSRLWSFLENVPETPLQIACENGNYLVAERLLVEGASVRPVEGGSSREPLFCVILKHYDSDDGKLIQLLLDHGALLYDHQLEDHFLLEAVKRIPKQYVGEKDPETGSFYDDKYSEEVAKGITEVFLLLSEYGDCYDTDGSGKNPLHWAAIMGNWYLVEVMVLRFDYRMDAEDIHGNTAFDLAAEEGAPDYILELLKVES